MNLQELIGKRVAELRKAKGLSQQKFSDDAGLERSNLTNIENGNNNISISTLEKILNTLDISTNDFFNTIEFSNK